MLEDENTQLKESLRKHEISQFPPWKRADSGHTDALERIWAEEKRRLEVEVGGFKEQLKAARQQSARDSATITTLEEKLKESSNSLPSNLDELDGEDLNDELTTPRKSLYPYIPIGVNDRRMQIVRLEKELAAAKAEAEIKNALRENECMPCKSF